MDLFGFEIHNFGIFLGNKILASIFRIVCKNEYRSGINKQTRTIQKVRLFFVNVI